MHSWVVRSDQKRAFATRREARLHALDVRLTQGDIDTVVVRREGRPPTHIFITDGPDAGAQPLVPMLRLQGESASRLVFRNGRFRGGPPPQATGQ